MKKELLTDEELSALKDATADFGVATNYWLFKIQLCFGVAISIMVTLAFYPDLVIDWLNLESASDLESLYAVLKTRAVSILILIVAAYFCYRHKPIFLCNTALSVRAGLNDAA